MDSAAEIFFFKNTYFNHWFQDSIIIFEGQRSENVHAPWRKTIIELKVNVTYSRRDVEK